MILTRPLPCAILAAVIALPVMAADGAATSKVFSSPAEAVAGNHEGATVLWGGRIFERESGESGQCIGVLAFPLARRDGRPDTRLEPGQIFYACSSEALSVDDYAVGRQVAVTGKLGPVRERVVSENCRTLPPNTAFVTWKATAVKQMPEGCTARLPVVQMSDGRTWPDPPRAHPPQFM
ncbi:starvation-inducible outer membrane lipoprotein [Dokdonella fugitiva]|uniref:Starvation-inducible outer membrane lipoprotein n=1 Tax=Dokdonella fugitiva TaxID=328517 RepID=A0A839EWF3_9GAMM|nr:Slp family lipoprotein [Dokdonella fugitiva]MBA8888957.1 starvation-inducible outer membrane lipoprotein [Dokdonella fugitiva]